MIKYTISKLLLLFCCKHINKQKLSILISIKNYSQDIFANNQIKKYILIHVCISVVPLLAIVTDFASKSQPIDIFSALQSLSH